MEAEPLSQRTTGRRAERRKRRDEVNNETTAATQASKESTGRDEGRDNGRRGPSAEKEKLIDDLIERRRKMMQQPTSILSYDDEPEILGNYEYLDHTADIQLHGWGDSLERALEEVTVAMFGYMTSLSLIQVNEGHSTLHGTNIEASGHDVESLAFAHLQEWLYVFHSTGFVAREINIHELDHESFKYCKSSGKGEICDWTRHSQGTEIKAVTYSNLQIKDVGGRCDIWVIVDI